MQQTALTGFAALNGPLEAPDDPAIAAEWAAAGLIGKTPTEAVRHVLYGGRSSSEVTFDWTETARSQCQNNGQLHPVDIVEIREARFHGVSIYMLASAYRVSVSVIRAAMLTDGAS